MLVSGAFVNRNGAPQEVEKVQGRPIVLRKNGTIKSATDSEINKIHTFLDKTFRNKPQILETTKDEINQGLNSMVPNLSRKNIESLLGGDEPIIVFWGGETDREILCRLKLGERRCFNLRAQRLEKRTNEFYLKLMDMDTGNVIKRVSLGDAVKGGDQLNLAEAHSLLCSNDHGVNRMHDPKNDVIVTQCIFNFLLNNNA